MKLMKSRLWQILFSVLFVSVVAVACSDDDDDNKGPEGKNKTFIQNVAYANSAEIDFGQLANSQGTSSGVKQFGQLMVQDHQKAQNDLDTVSGNRNIDLPSGLMADKQQMRQVLAARTGYAFDTAYIHGQIKMHTETRNMFQAFLDTSNDQSLKMYVNRYLPAVINHLHKADSISTALDNINQGM